MENKDSTTFLNDVLSNEFIILMMILILLLTMTHQGVVAKKKDDTNTTSLESAMPEPDEKSIINPVVYRIEHPNCVVALDFVEGNQSVIWSQYDESELEEMRVGQLRFRPDKENPSIILKFKKCKTSSTDIRVVRLLDAQNNEAMKSFSLKAKSIRLRYAYDKGKWENEG